MSHTSEEIRKIARECGACAVGFVPAEPVEEEQERRFDRWLTLGLNGELAYMANHRDLRSDPRLLLPDARTVISLAFPYPAGSFAIPIPPFPAGIRSGAEAKPTKASISSYALGEDYHIALRRRMEPLLGHLRASDGEVRVCIDSAPIHERYWAIKSGLGSVGRNGSLIIPGIGSRIFLAEILWTGTLETHKAVAATRISRFVEDGVPPSESRVSRFVEGGDLAPDCLTCRRCVDACPTGAITPDGIDARRCLSALTIEHRGDFTPEQTALLREAAEKGRGVLFGCDICRDICPHNRPISLQETLPESIPEFFPESSAPRENPVGCGGEADHCVPLPEFQPNEAIKNLTGEEIMTMTGGQFKRRFAASPLLRVGLKGLRRNLSAILR